MNESPVYCFACGGPLRAELPFVSVLVRGYKAKGDALPGIMRYFHVRCWDRVRPTTFGPINFG